MVHLVRSIPVSGMNGVSCEDRIRESVGAMPGVLGVSVSHRRGLVRVSYDPCRVRLDEVEECLGGLGYGQPRSWLARLRRSWNHFSEENALDGMKSVRVCCSRQPPRR